jgi:hypothetical protein
MSAKETAPKKQTSGPREFGNSYVTLRPEQKKLVDDYVSHYNQTTGSKIAPQTAYDGARLSVRTTLDAVTHALLNAKMTEATGKSLGRAIDLVDAVDEIMGEEAGVGGDRQFRIYFYVKPTAFDTLASSQEFLREHDNTVYHKGFPICFRLRNGPPSLRSRCRETAAWSTLTWITARRVFRKPYSMDTLPRAIQTCGQATTWIGTTIDGPA